MSDSDSMIRAIELAKQAALLDEVPVGAVVTHNGIIVGEGFNRRETGKNALAHAEIEAINRETAELTKRIALKWTIIDIVLAVFCRILIVLAVRMIWEGIRERKERKAQEVVGGYVFVPVVTDTIQVKDGIVYHKMGIAGKVKY